MMHVSERLPLFQAFPAAFRMKKQAEEEEEKVKVPAKEKTGMGRLQAMMKTVDASVAASTKGWGGRTPRHDREGGASDEALTCRDCKAAFTFTAGEQVFPDL